MRYRLQSLLTDRRAGDFGLRRDADRRSEVLNLLANVLPRKSFPVIPVQRVFCPSLGFTNRVLRLGEDDDPWTQWFIRTTRPADGGLVQGPGTAVALTVADCVPVCLREEDRFAVLHGSTRSLLRADRGEPSILAVALARGPFTPARLRAVVGPGIGPCCYGLDTLPPGTPPEVVRTPERGPRRTKPHALDLPALICQQLAEAGVDRKQISVKTRCTACAEESGTPRYWSHVRGDPERQCFLAWLNETG